MMHSAGSRCFPERKSSSIVFLSLRPRDQDGAADHALEAQRAVRHRQRVRFLAQHVAAVEDLGVGIHDAPPEPVVVVVVAGQAVETVAGLDGVLQDGRRRRDLARSYSRERHAAVLAHKRPRLLVTGSLEKHQIDAPKEKEKDAEPATVCARLMAAMASMRTCSTR